MPVTDVQSKANCDWLISTVLSRDLWLIKCGEVAGSAERLHELLVFFSQQMESTAPPLRHKLIRGRSGREGRIVGSLRLLPVLERLLEM